ncbi:hypothetical protein JMJ35_004004 [Cladonia borealis]|uniref:Uncharacterized protein n=1 Tax=Cladonia borealis TaxID=184061 RepID=A0AA39R2I6_9LECA|nr:hypothetical protein JMJ35_004004 [Cladonia borealis]
MPSPKPHRPILRPLIIPPHTTSPSIRNITAIHNPIRTFPTTTKTVGKAPPTPTSPLTPNTLTAIPITPPLAAPKMNSNDHNNNTPAVTDSKPLTPLPNYTNTNTDTNRSKNATRQKEEKEQKEGSLWTRRQDLRLKAGIVTACVGAVVGTVGLTVYFVVLKAKGEI